jgi:peptidoglycan/LPS O-acetylase OafA/YrhL
LLALDGMRGLAAIVVVLYHLSLVARPFLDTGTLGDAWWWVAKSPLKILTAGSESVLIFFVLSGLVVALPTLRAGFSWRQFFASRFVRLYLPVWGALTFGAMLILVFPRDATAITAHTWINSGSAKAVSIESFLTQASLFRINYPIDNVLWSLRWEVIFSLLLPVFVGLAYVLRRFWLAAALVAAALSVTGRIIGLDALVYLPVFFLGTIIAVRLPDFREWARGRGNTYWMLVLSASLLLIVLSPLVRFIFPAGSFTSSLIWGLAAVGAVGLIVTAIGSDRVGGFLSMRVPQWLGKVSFSLYLVHIPILATVTFLVGDQNWWLVAIITVPLSLAAGWLFHRYVELPTHSLARAAGRVVVSKRTLRRSAVTST